MKHDWDLDNAEVQAPVKDRRSILSVAFTQEEFAAVAEKARREGKAVSRYVHDEALAYVNVPTWRILDSGNATINFARTA